MFDLEERIAQWRRTLAETGGCHPEVIEELESHLRESLGQLVQAGHPPEQALQVALARLGSPQSLAAEFAKTAAPPAAPWLPARLGLIVAGALALWMAGILTARIQAGQMSLLLVSHVYAVTLGYSATFLVGFLAICYVATRPFRDLSPGQMQSLRRLVVGLTIAATALTFLGVLLGGIWAQENLGRFWGWDLKEIGGASVLAWDLTVLLLLWRFRSHTPLLLLSGMVGNIVVSLAWFGPAAVTAASFPSSLLILFVLSQAVLLALGLVPAGQLKKREV
jgi:hypothetical protein